MTTKVSHNDAAGTASTQVSLGEVLSDFDVEEPAEEPDDETEIDPTVDLSIKVGVGEEKDHYHLMWTVGDDEIISACPHHDLQIISLKEAAEEGSQPCEVCNPIDWRLDEENTTEEGT
jgi:hypothetical protein